MNKQINRAEVPDLKEILNRHKEEIMSELNCVTIGTVQSFDATTQSATIKVNYKRVLKNIDLGNDVIGDKVIEYPLLVKCPIAFIFGGTAGLTMPIASGDTCIVLFSDRDIDNWQAYGDANNIPNSDRMHSINDGIAIVGIRNTSNALSGYSSTDIKLYLGSSYLTIKANGDIELSSPGNIVITGTNAVQINPL